MPLAFVGSPEGRGIWGKYIRIEAQALTAQVVFLRLRVLGLVEWWKWKWKYWVCYGTSYRFMIAGGFMSVACKIFAKLRLLRSSSDSREAMGGFSLAS